MTYEEVMNELRIYGSAQTRKIYLNHGADIPLFGVSIANLKKIAKGNKNNHDLGYKLLVTNNVDAIYLSQYIVDPKKLTIYELEKLILATNYYMILDNVVANLAARNMAIVFECLSKWVNHKNDRYRQVAYSLYSTILVSYNNNLINREDVLLKINHVRSAIHSEENRVRYSMNNFLIAAASAFSELTEICKEVALEIGEIKVYMGDTSCKVPDALSYIIKIESMGNIGKKRKI